MIQFEGIPAHELRHLARAIRSERLSSPFLASMLAPYCHTVSKEALAGALNQFVSEGMQPRHLALLLETMASKQEAELQLAEAVQLVWTGPEPVKASNRDTSIVVRDLFSLAERDVLLVGYRIRQGLHIFDPLCERMNQFPRLKVRLILDVSRQEHHSDWSIECIAKAFRTHFFEHEWPGTQIPELFYDPRSCQNISGQHSSLHAKCLVIDGKHSLITSANFTSAGQERNLEVGVTVHSVSFAQQLTQHFEQLIQENLLVKM
ncbi:MAG: DISARM system phospholipase D-like protein DrmC [Gemmatales bacterium]